MEKHSKILVLGHNGMVGSSIIRNLKNNGFSNMRTTYGKGIVDLRRQNSVESVFEEIRPDYVFLAAAKVGGIMANKTYPAEFIYDNIMIGTNVIECCRKYEVKKLLYLASSCIYPKFCPQPMSPDHLLSGPLEPTNEAYSVAKISGIKMCEFYRKQYGCNFIACQPTNLYGPNDSYDLNNSHVIPALIRKFHEAKTRGDSEVVIWGTGRVYREFLHVDDLSEACVFLMKEYDDGQLINIGGGEEKTIKEISEIIRSVVGFDGKLTFDIGKPDGTPRKLLDSSKIFCLGWRPRISLEDGLKSTYLDFKEKFLLEKM